MKEIFKDVVGYEGRYEVSNKGCVVSLLYGKRKVLKDFPSKQGYRLVKLSIGNQISKTRTIHLIVAHAFLNHKSNGRQEIVVDHIDNNKANNNLDNLKLIPQRENATKGKEVKGYSFHKKSGSYLSRIYFNKKHITLGYFKTPDQAQQAYKNALEKILKTNTI